MQTAYPNIYFPLNLYKKGQESGSTFEKIKKGELPVMNIFYDKSYHNGYDMVATPPPMNGRISQSDIPIPAGSGGITVTEIRIGIFYIGIFYIRIND